MSRIILENRAHLRAYMQQALDNMVYYRGDIKLSVQIGTPVLFQWIPSFRKMLTDSRYPGRQTEYHDLEKFMTIMKNPKIQSELVR